MKPKTLTAPEAAQMVVAALFSRANEYSWGSYHLHHTGEYTQRRRSFLWAFSMTPSWGLPFSSVGDEAIDCITVLLPLSWTWWHGMLSLERTEPAKYVPPPQDPRWKYSPYYTGFEGLSLDDLRLLNVLKHSLVWERLVF